MLQIFEVRRLETPITVRQGDYICRLRLSTWCSGARTNGGVLVHSARRRSRSPCDSQRFRVGRPGGIVTRAGGGECFPVLGFWCCCRSWMLWKHRDGASSMRLPNCYGPDADFTLDQTFLCEMRVYPLLCFCIGVGLMFSRERGRQRCRLDWTRRWGVICSYVTLLLAAAPILFISTLVLLGLAALFISMPLKYQPWLLKRSIATDCTFGRTCS